MAKALQVPAFIQDLRERLGISGLLSLQLDETVSPVVVLDVPETRPALNTRIRPAWGDIEMGAGVGLTAASSLTFRAGATVICHLQGINFESSSSGRWSFWLLGDGTLTDPGAEFFRDERIPGAGVEGAPQVEILGQVGGAVVAARRMFSVRLTAQKLSEFFPLDLWLDPTQSVTVQFDQPNVSHQITWFWEEFDQQLTPTA